MPKQNGIDNEADSGQESDTHQRFLRHLMSNRQRLLAFIIVMVHDRARVEDIFQDLSLILWEKFQIYEEGTSFGGWARQVAVNVIRNARRRAARDASLLPLESSQFVVEGFTRVEEHATEQEWRQALNKCMAQLGQSARRLIELRYFEQRRLGEIAQQLGRTVNGIKTSLNRVRIALASCMRQSVGRI